MTLGPDENPRFLASFFTVPFAMVLTGTEALPGPTLVELLKACGHTEGAAKSILHRMSQGDALELRRFGRVGQYRLIGQIAWEAQNLVTGNSLRPGWDGRFHTIIYNIPESDRGARLRLRTDAFAHGYAPLRSGLLIAPTDQSHFFVDRFPDQDIICGWLDLPDADERRLVREAWRLDEQYPRYRHVIDWLTELATHDLRALPGAEALPLLRQVVEGSLEIQMLAGSLPVELLPEDWPGQELNERFQVVAKALYRATFDYASSIVDASSYPHLVERIEGPVPNTIHLG